MDHAGVGVEAQQLQALPIFQGLLYHRCIQPRLRHLGCYLRDGDRPPTGVRQGQDRVEDQVERVARAGLRVEGAFCSGRGEAWRSVTPTPRAPGSSADPAAAVGARTGGPLGSNGWYVGCVSGARPCTAVPSPPRPPT